MALMLYRDLRLMLLVLAVIAAAGASGWWSLPRLEDPRMAARGGLIVTLLPGESAEQVEALVTQRVEDALQEIKEVNELRSSSRSGLSAVLVLLSDDAKAVSEVWARVRDQLERAQLPPGASKPKLQTIEHEDAYSLIVGLSWQGPGEPSLAILKRLGDELADRLRDVPGTEYARLFGAPQEEVTVELDANAAAAYGLSAEQVAMTLARSDAKVSAGQVRSPAADVLVEVKGELDSLAQIGQVTVGQGPDGAGLRLSDVATIRKAAADPPLQLAVLNGKRGLAVAARLDPAKRIDVWAEQAREAVRQFQASLPATIHVDTLLDQSHYAATRLDGLVWNLALSAMLVFGVLVFSMGWLVGLMVSVALPLCACMVLYGMQLMSIPIHQMSVMGLVIAEGLLIDNVIIAVDEVQQRMEAGQTPARAVRNSMRYLTAPLVASTITTVLAFMPLVLMPGRSGEFVGAVGVTVVMSLVASLAIALTLGLAGAGRLLRDPEGRRAHKAGGVQQKPRPWWRLRARSGMEVGGMAPPFASLVRGCLRRPRLTIAVLFAPAALGFAVGPLLSEQFFPPAERDMFHVQLRLAPLTSLPATTEAAERARAVMLADADVQAVDWFISDNAPQFYYNVVGTESGSPFFAQAIVRIRPEAAPGPVIRRLQAQLDVALPQAQVLVRQLEQGPPFDAPVEVRLIGHDVQLLRAKGEELRALLAQMPDVVHTRALLGEDMPKLLVSPDPDELRLTGLSSAALATQLQSALVGQLGGSMLEGGELLPVRVRLAESARADVRDIANMSLLAPALNPSAEPPSGSPLAQAAESQRRGQASAIPLTAVGETSLEPEQSLVYRFDRRRCNTVQAFLQAGALPSDTLTLIQRRMKEVGFTLPPGYAIRIGGEDAERSAAVTDLFRYVPLLGALMVVSLVAAVRSFRLTWIICAIAALSVGLALLCLWLCAYPLGFMAMVGLVGLVGIAVNDAIVLITAIVADPRAKAGDLEALVDVTMRNTRHILSTTFTNVGGYLPLALAGGLFWPPMAVTVIGGLAGATLMALFMAPTMYLLIRNATGEPRARL